MQSIKLREYTSISPGLRCPNCHSDNTFYSCLNEKHQCFDCLTLFNKEEAYTRQPNLTQITELEDGGCYLKRLSDGALFYLTKKDRQPQVVWDEVAWQQKWVLIQKEREAQRQALDFIKSLTPEQLQELHQNFAH